MKHTVSSLGLFLETIYALNIRRLEESSKIHRLLLCRSISCGQTKSAYKPPTPASTPSLFFTNRLDKKRLYAFLFVLLLANNKHRINDNMNNNNIDFITYCIGNLARRLNMSATEVYRRLKQSDILNGYIIPSYDVLHTFSKEYLMEDLTEYMREKGVLA